MTATSGRTASGAASETARRPAIWGASSEDPGARRVMAIAAMGAAHQLWFYGYENHPIAPEVRRAQTDSMLSLQNRHNRHFGLGDVEDPRGASSNCTDVDCMTVLALNYHRLDYRRAEVERALHDAAHAILTDKLNADGVLQSEPGSPFTHCFNSVPSLSPPDAGNMLDQSFYLWAVIAACSVVPSSEDPGLRSFLDGDWPRSPSHWLWVAPRRGQEAT